MASVVVRVLAEMSECDAASDRQITMGNISVLKLDRKGAAEGVGRHNVPVDAKNVADSAGICLGNRWRGRHAMEPGSLLAKS
jgi:hypothetical protein